MAQPTPDASHDPAFAAILDRYFAITRVPYDEFTDRKSVV